jgi:hypothetical protein
MIDMAVGDEYVPYFKTAICYRVNDAKHLVTGIDNKTFHGFFASQDIAIGLVWPNDEFSEHKAAP